MRQICIPRKFCLLLEWYKPTLRGSKMAGPRPHSHDAKYRRERAATQLQLPPGLDLDRSEIPLWEGGELRGYWAREWTLSSDAMAILIFIVDKKKYKEAASPSPLLAIFLQVWSSTAVFSLVSHRSSFKDAGFSCEPRHRLGDWRCGSAKQRKAPKHCRTWSLRPYRDQQPIRHFWWNHCHWR